jgi:3'-phosphoadenosine 5'-phosphosulfate (PAPS) 3'-phosphatase
MNLGENDLKNLCTAAIEAARKAGKYISETRPQNVQHKTGGEHLASQVVTEVDQQSQEIILQILEPTLAPFDLALLTEESEDDHSRLEKDYFWCIDPLDGTLSFIQGEPGYSVSIALIARDGTPQIGVVYDPVEQTLYHAIKGQGAFRDGIPWKLPAPPTGPHPLRLITDHSFAEHTCSPAVLKELERISAELGFQGLETLLRGGGVMNALWVLENTPACYFKFPRPKEGGGCLWDFAASACIFNEIGAIVTDIHGNPLDLNRADSCYMNHRGILYTTDDTLAGKIRNLYTLLT